MKFSALPLLVIATPLLAAAQATLPVNATDFNQWQVQTLSGVPVAGSQTVMLSQCFAAGPYAGVPVVSTNAPVTVDTGTLAEVVTPAAVSTAPCSFTASFALVHPARFTVRSATGGLQEAINYEVAHGGGTVRITADWPGTQANINSAVGNATVFLQDIRGPIVSYGWSGAAYAATSTQSAASTIVSSILTGACTGTATSSATLGLFGLGQFAAATCNQSTVNLGQVVRAGTLTTLSVSAGTGGKNASSGVVTVLDNGVATALTCTVGVAASCTDLAHSVTVAAGDIVSVQFTTQASETLAAVRATVILR